MSVKNIRDVQVLQNKVNDGKEVEVLHTNRVQTITNLVKITGYTLEDVGEFQNGSSNPLRGRHRGYSSTCQEV